MRRPGRVTLLALVFLLISLVGFSRFGWFIGDWKSIWSVTGPSIFWFELNTSFACGIGSLILAWLVWSGSPISLYAVPAWMAVLTAGVWIDRLVVMVNPSARTNGLFILVINLLVGLFIMGSLFSKQSLEYLKRNTNG